VAGAATVTKPGVIASALMANTPDREHVDREHVDHEHVGRARLIALVANTSGRRVEP
jgi:hypothetical protein